ncbi:MAG: glycosyltransferase [Acidobacteria bacterium]|nr:glycosyltransferase [Acidobacteriota bacterium]
MPALIGFLALGLALWLALWVWNLRYNRGVPRVSSRMEFSLREHPRVSILIPARNEAKILWQTLPAFLAQDYDNYEVILVDDASTDGTAVVAEQCARRYPGKLRVIRVESLPADWVGKAHALHLAFQAAGGEWVLATDADIFFHPKALRAGLWLAEQQRAELVSIYAFLECGSFWEKVILPGFGLFLATFFPLRKINDSNSTVALASGGYILMRRRVWDRLGGYEAIRAEMIDDLNTARIVKHSGHRIFAAVTKDLARTRMYPGLAGIWEGLRKNAFAGHRYSVARLLGVVGGSFLCNLLPLLYLGYFGWELARQSGLAEPARVVFALSLAQYLLTVLLHVPLLLFYEIGLGYAFLAPFGAILYACICLDSMGRTLLGRGVTWKLRHYGRPPVASES